MKPSSRFADRVLVQGAVAGLLMTAVVLVLRAAGAFEAVDLKAYDALLRSRPAVEAADPRIVYIEMTEEDIQRQGRWPMTDAVLAEVLERIVAAGPRAVGLDIYRDIEVPPGRAELDRQLKTHPNVIGVVKLGDPAHPGIAPPAALQGSEQTGFNDMLVDRDGIVRRGLLFLDQGEQVQYGFALRLALLYLQREGIVPVPDPINPEFLRLGSVTIRPMESSEGGYVGADARGYQFMLDYRAAEAKPVSFSVADLLEGRVPRDRLRDKVVLVGVNAPSVPDLFHTPFTAGDEQGAIVPGVRLHGQAVSQLIRAGLNGERPLRVLSECEEAGWILMWGLLAGWLAWLGRSVWIFTLLGAAGLGVLVAATVSLFRQGWWIPLVPAAVNWTLAASAMTASVLNAERKQRAMLMNLFSRHVSGEVAEAIWRQRDQFLDGGRPRSQEMIVTVLFSDFKGYTSTAEKMQPQVLMDWLNSYLEAMSEVIGGHGGVIDDYAGDGIKANFGVPIPRITEADIGREARRAVSCALAMERELTALNRSWQAKGRRPVGMRIGLCTGPVVSGSLGSAQRLKYTTVGDTVNAGSRLESLDLERAPMSPGSLCRILIDERTKSYLSGECRTEAIGEVMVKGKQQPLLVHRVLAESGSDIHGEADSRR